MTKFSSKKDLSIKRYEYLKLGNFLEIFSDFFEFIKKNSNLLLSFFCFKDFSSLKIKKRYLIVHFDMTH